MPHPEINTPLPGPKSRLVIDADASVSSPSLIKEYPLVVHRGEGMMIEDLDGNRFLDFMSGIAVAITGHAHPDVVRAIHEQTDRFLHICGTDFYYTSYTELCQKLAALTPGEEDWTIFLANSGAEAVEGAIKLSRYHTKRSIIIAFYGAFHGRTCGALSLTSSKTTQRAGFSPLLPDVIHQPYAYCYRCPYHLEYPRCDIYCVESWRDTLFKTKVAPDEVAAVFVEPIQGEGGHIVPPPEYLPRLRKLCDEFGILLVADEIQCGMGRTGRFFAMEHRDIVPDIITLGKGLASGMPLSAIMAKKSVMTWPKGSHGSTFGGNPVCCAASLATLKLLEDGLMENARRMGEALRQELERLKDKYPVIGDVRGEGLMLALEFIEDPGSKKRSPEYAEKFVQACFQEGLLVLGCGESSVRLAPPLIVSSSDIDSAVGIMDSVLSR
jgi:4-aminobutyrate aminotransferase